MTIEDGYEMIKAGDEIGYLTIIKDGAGFLRKIYNHRLTTTLTFDEWESEALDVLIRVVRHYDKNNRAKFSSYYYQALNNRSIDILRKAMREKKRRDQEFPLTIMENLGLEIVDPISDIHEARHNVQRAIAKIDISTPLKKAAYLELFGKEKEVGRSFASTSMKRAKKHMYREVRKYLYENNEVA